tara:strand:- start:424 stop:609 length:186 start_codon:yes stop_codon:yes gene_type:complete
MDTSVKAVGACLQFNELRLICVFKGLKIESKVGSNNGVTSVDGKISLTRSIISIEGTFYIH